MQKSRFTWALEAQEKRTKTRKKLTSNMSILIGVAHKSLRGSRKKIKILPNGAQQ
jgi:hypothetical protein